MMRISHPAGFGLQRDRHRQLPVTLLPSLARLVLTRLGWLFATGDSRDAEILALRHQILVLLTTAIARSRRSLTFLIVRPDTVLRWHQRLIAQH